MRVTKKWVDFEHVVSGGKGKKKRKKRRSSEGDVGE